MFRVYLAETNPYNDRCEASLSTTAYIVVVFCTYMIPFNAGLRAVAWIIQDVLV